MRIIKEFFTRQPRTYGSWTTKHPWMSLDCFYCWIQSDMAIALWKAWRRNRRHPMPLSVEVLYYLPINARETLAWKVNTVRADKLFSYEDQETVRKLIECCVAQATLRLKELLEAQETAARE